VGRCAPSGSTSTGWTSWAIRCRCSNGVAHQVTTGTNVKLAPTISPDGTTVAFFEQSPKTGNDLSIVRLPGAAATPDAGRAPSASESSGAQMTPLIQTPFTEALPEISPDGRWLAYMSDDSGQLQVYVRPFPDVNTGRWQVSVAGGNRPVWARNGRELFYASPTGTIMAVPVGTGSTFTSGTATKLFAWPTIAAPGQARTYDISRDGQRFLMVKEAGGDRKDAPSATITVVLNWVEELKAKLPSK
jgi:Tol biopolymer transport system component